MSLATLLGGAARHAAVAVARGAAGHRRAVGPARPGARVRLAAEPLERRTLLSTTATLTGTPGTDAFLATLDSSGQNVQFYVNATPATGSPVQTVPVSQLGGLVVNGGGGTDALTVNTPGATFALDASGTAALSLEVDGGTVQVASAQSLTSVGVGPQGTLSMAGPAAALTVGSPGVTVAGLFDHEAGVLTTSTLYVASSGTFRDVGGAVAGPMGQAPFLAIGGLFDAVTSASLAGATGTLYIGAGGTYRVDNGGNAGAMTTPGPSVVVGNGSGTIDVAAGTLSVPGSIDVQGGVTLTLDGAGTVSMPGWNIGDATVTQTAGTVAVAGGLSVGADWGAATYDLLAGTLQAGGLYVGGFSTGRLIQSGGTLLTTHFELGSYGNGTWYQSGGSSSVGDLFLGYDYGQGLAGLSGGQTAATSVNCGQFAGASGELDLSGSADLTVAGTEALGAAGDGGRGTLRQSGGTNAAGTLLVGSDGTGAYDQSGGTDAVGAGGLWLGYDGNAAGTYALSGGTLADAGHLIVGTYGGAASAFDQSGGTATVAANLGVGLVGPGAMAVTGGALAVAGNAYVGLYGPGTLSLGGAGTLAVANALYVSGDGADGDPAGTGTVDLGAGGTLSTQQTYVGYSGPATFDQTGGTHTTQALVLNGPGGAYATYAVTGGTVNATATVNVQQPSADGPASVDEGSPYTLGLSATSSVGVNAITGWAVDWGDGASDQLPGNPPSAQHTYDAGGNTYTVSPTAYGGGRAYPAAPVPVLVNDVPAAVLIGGEPSTAADPAVLSGTAGQPVTLSATFADPGVNETHAATINWGDGTTSAATVTESNGSGTVTASHVYDTDGTLNATLAVTDSGGATATVPFAVQVAYVAPTFAVAFSPAPAATAGQPATLELTTDGPEALGVTGWSVDWGDGTVDTYENIPGDVGSANGQPQTLTLEAHAYAAAGDYRVQVVATDGESDAHLAGVATVAVAAAPPTGVTATAVDDDTVEVDWTPDPATGDTQYEVDRQAPDGTWTDLATVDDSTDGDTYTDAGLTADATYSYRVIALGPTPDLNAAPAGPATATTPLTTPDAPTDLSATESTPGEVDLSWGEDSPLVSGYLITATPAAGGAAVTYTAPGDAAAFAATGLTPDVAYSFAVTADNDQGPAGDARSAPSAPVTATAPAAALSATTPATVAEGAAVALSLSAGAPAAGGSPVTSWQVSWDDGTVDTLPAGAAGSTLTDPHAPAAAASLTTATITATDAAGDTFTLPAVLADVVPTAPTNVVVTVASQTEVDLAWTDASQSATGYTVLRADAGSTTFADVADLPAGTTSYADTGLVPSTQYDYEVESSGGSFDQTDSTPAPANASVTTPAPAQVELDAVAVLGHPDEVVLAWTYRGGDDGGGYELEMEDTSVPGQNFALFATPGPVGAGGQGYCTQGGLTVGDDYKFRIRADHADGTVSDYAGASFQPGNVPGPAAPSISAGADGSLTVGFGAGDAGQFQYEFRGGANPGPGWWYPDPDSYPYEFDIGPSGGTVYQGAWAFSGDQARVRALTPDGYTAWSDPASLPPPPDQPSATVSARAVSGTEVDVTVGGGPANARGNGNYYYSACLDGLAAGQEGEMDYGSYYLSYAGTDATHTFAFTGLKPGTTYYASGSTENPPTGGPAWPDRYVAAGSATTTGTVLPAAPAFAHAVYDPSSAFPKIHLAWANTPSNEAGYTIYRLLPNGTSARVASSGPDVTTKDYRPTDNGPYIFHIYSDGQGSSESTTFATATCAAIGGPDITQHLINIELHMATMMRIPSVYAKLREIYFGGGQNLNDNWDVVNLGGQSVHTSENCGLLPDGTATVTVAGAVYKDAEVNYWLYGAWVAAVGENYEFAYSLVALHASTTTEGASGNLKWFKA